MTGKVCAWLNYRGLIVFDTVLEIGHPGQVIVRYLGDPI